MSGAPICSQGSFAFVDLFLPVPVNATHKGGAYQAQEKSQSQTQQPSFLQVATV